MHNVLFMIITMIGLAGLFILLQAEFVAMVQVVVYARSRHGAVPLRDHASQSGSDTIADDPRRCVMIGNRLRWRCWS